MAARDEKFLVLRVIQIEEKQLQMSEQENKAFNLKFLTPVDLVERNN